MVRPATVPRICRASSKAVASGLWRKVSCFLSIQTLVRVRGAVARLMSGLGTAGTDPLVHLALLVVCLVGMVGLLFVWWRRWQLLLLRRQRVGPRARARLSLLDNVRPGVRRCRQALL